MNDLATITDWLDHLLKSSKDGDRESIETLEDIYERFGPSVSVRAIERAINSISNKDKWYPLGPVGKAMAIYAIMNDKFNFDEICSFSLRVFIPRLRYDESTAHGYVSTTLQKWKKAGFATFHMKNWSLTPEGRKAFIEAGAGKP